MKKAYPKYNDTGVEWLGQAPEHWEVFPLWSVTQLKSMKNYPEEELLSVYLNLGVIRFSDVDEKRTNATSLDLSNYRLVEPGDFVLNNQQAWRGSVGVSQYKGIISPAYLVLALSQSVDPSFGNYFFRNGSTVGQYLICSKGVGTIQRNLYWNELKRVKICLPPLPEQHQIAAFLDHKCALIDTFIEKKTRLIELLKEQKQAIINKAVTKGIDPDVKMKPSGIEWLGDIPEHWEVRKLKYFCSVISKGTTPSTEGKDFASSGIRFLKAENIWEGEVNLNPEFFIDDDTHEKLKRSQLCENDLLIVIAGATIGKIGIVKKEILPANTNQAVSFLRLRDPKNLEYLHLALQSEFIQELVRFEAVQAAQPNLAMGVLGNFRIPTAPFEEQRRIVYSIKNETQLIQKTIQRVQKEIQLIKEYKTTLIAEAVTGKIDVRDWKPKESEQETEETLNQLSYATKN